MDQARSERLDAAAGIAFVVLAVLSGYVAGTPPVATDSVGKITTFLTDKREELQASSFFLGLAMLAFLWFLGSLRGRLRDAEGGTGRLTAVAFGSGLVLVSLAFVAQGLLMAGTLHVAALDDSTIRALFDGSTYVFEMTAFAGAGLTAAVAAVTLRYGALPTAIGVLSAIAAAVQVISALSLYGEDDSFLSIGGTAPMIAFFLFLIWALATSIALLVRAYPRVDGGHEDHAREGAADRAAPGAA